MEGLPWLFKPLPLFRLSFCPTAASSSHQFFDNGINRIEAGEAAFCDNPVAKPQALLTVCIVLGVSCDFFPERRDPLSRCAAEPKKRPKQQGFRIEVDPENAGRGPVDQLYVGRYRCPLGVRGRGRSCAKGRATARPETRVRPAFHGRWIRRSARRRLRKSTLGFQSTSLDSLGC
jgi:hypothetical protein